MEKWWDLSIDRAVHLNILHQALTCPQERLWEEFIIPQQLFNTFHLFFFESIYVAGKKNNKKTNIFTKNNSGQVWHNPYILEN